MSSQVSTPATPRRSARQERATIASQFSSYYIDDVDGNVPRANSSTTPVTKPTRLLKAKRGKTAPESEYRTSDLPPSAYTVMRNLPSIKTAATPSTPAAKKPATRKRDVKTPQTSSSSASDATPVKRSARIANGIKLPKRFVEVDETDSAKSTPSKRKNNEDDSADSTPTKKQKTRRTLKLTNKSFKKPTTTSADEQTTTSDSEQSTNSAQEQRATSNEAQDTAATIVTPAQLLSAEQYERVPWFDVKERGTIKYHTVEASGKLRLFASANFNIGVGDEIHAVKDREDWRVMPGPITGSKSIGVSKRGADADVEDGPSRPAKRPKLDYTGGKTSNTIADDDVFEDAAGVAPKAPESIGFKLPKAGTKEARMKVVSTGTDASDNSDDAAEAPAGTQAVEDIEEAPTKPTGRKSKGKGKAKAIDTSKANDDGGDDVPFEGTANGFGSSIERPKSATNTTHWNCANRSCKTGQTWHPRDGKNSFGRKVISNFFGRNKKETSLIHRDVWHTYCRKDYQRQTYEASKTSEKKCKWYVENIRMQLDRIEIWRPNALFKVQLSKGGKARLAEYHRQLNKLMFEGGYDKEDAEFMADGFMKPQPQTGTKGHEKPLSLEEGFPVKLLNHFASNFCCDNHAFGFGDLVTILYWINEQVDQGKTEYLPPMEFLINEQGDDSCTDPSTNYENWCKLEDERVETERFFSPSQKRDEGAENGDGEVQE